MKRELAARALLALAGVVAIGIGASVLLSPSAFYDDLDFPMTASLSNELRASAGWLLTSGLGMLAGVCWSRLRAAAGLSAGALYLSYAAARLFGWAMSGRPADTLVVAAGVELVLGSCCAAMFWRGDAFSRAR